MSLWLCLRFEQLPLQCLNRDETRPVAVLEKQRVLRANDCARTLGIKPGQGTATVRALAAEMPLTLLERDRDAEQRCLRQLCCWAYSITPSLHSWREDCLLLEIGSCLSLYRGLDSLLAEVTGGLVSRGYGVLVPDFRGSAGYGRGWLDAGDGEFGNGMVDDVVDATRAAIEAGLAKEDAVAIAGWSR